MNDMVKSPKQILVSSMCFSFSLQRSDGWQSYVDRQLIATGMVKEACIAGHDGNIWAKSSNCHATAHELREILGKFGDTDRLASSGIEFDGVRYMYLSSNNKVIRAKRGTSGIHICKSTQTLIVGTYEDPVVPEKAATVSRKNFANTLSMLDINKLL